MIVGTADLDALATRAPALKNYAREAVTLENATCVQLTMEMHNKAREAVLPPALHPTIPPCLSVGAWKVPDSVWGAFQLVFVRVTCRSGVRARGFTTAAFCDSQLALDGLRDTFGFPAELRDTRIAATYSGVEVEVAGALRFSGIEPEPMSNNDVQYTGSLNLASTPSGLRLLQVEASHEASQVDRLTATLQVFNASACGNPLLDPYHVVSASVARETIVLQPLRFQCKADELAFTGTEPVPDTPE